MFGDLGVQGLGFGGLGSRDESLGVWGSGMRVWGSGDSRIRV